MKYTDYIIPIGEDAQDYDEMFIGVIRRQPELVRCKNCKYFDFGWNEAEAWSDCEIHKGHVCDSDFCSWAEKKKE